MNHSGRGASLTSVMWSALLVPLLAASSSTLAAYAGSSPRPAECRALAGAGEVWEQARGQPTRRFCLLLARGYARLATAPGEAFELARKARALLPNAAEPRVLEGRAQLRLGEFEAAYKALAGAVTQPGRPLGDVHALRELGISAVSVGQLAAARSAYRSLVARAGFLEDPVFAKRTAIEAAAVLLASEESDLSDAIIYLSEARRGARVPGLSDLLTAQLGLCLDRAGRTEDAEIVLRELNGAWSLVHWLSERERLLLSETADQPLQALPKRHFDESALYLAEPEIFAIVGAAARATDARLARTYLDAYVRRGGRAQAWARQRLASLPPDRGLR